MNIEQAINTAIEYEIRVRDTYVEAAEEAITPEAKKVFKILGDEENEHVLYLEYKLKVWSEKGELSAEDLTTAIPQADDIAEAIKKLDAKPATEVPRSELEALKRAFDIEKETSDFYNGLTRDLDEKGRLFFKRFVEIEEGHLSLLQAEMGSVSGSGFWFDFQEFDLENG